MKSRQNHVQIQIIASPTAQRLVTTNPEELKALEEAEAQNAQDDEGFNMPLQ